MKTKVKVEQPTRYKTVEIELPLFYHYDHGGDGYSVDQYSKFDGKIITSVTRTNYYVDGEISYEIEKQKRQISSDAVKPENKSSEKEFNDALAELKQFITDI